MNEHKIAKALAYSGVAFVISIIAVIVTVIVGSFVQNTVSGSLTIGNFAALAVAIVLVVQLYVAWVHFKKV